MGGLPSAAMREEVDAATSDVPNVPEQASDLIAGLERLLHEARTEHDDLTTGNKDERRALDVRGDIDELDVHLRSTKLTVDHMSHHVPKLKDCPVCVRG